jgi:hypothetical protein
VRVWFDWRTRSVRFTMKPQKVRKKHRAWCRAKTRRGTPCRCLALPNGRCKYHGGLSTGPKTPEGQARALANLRQYRDRGEDRHD